MTCPFTAGCLLADRLPSFCRTPRCGIGFCVEKSSQSCCNLRMSDEEVGNREVHLVVGERRAVQARSHTPCRSRYRNGRRRIPLKLAPVMNVGIDLPTQHRSHLVAGGAHRYERYPSGGFELLQPSRGSGAAHGNAYGPSTCRRELNGAVAPIRLAARWQHHSAERQPARTFPSGDVNGKVVTPTVCPHPLTKLSRSIEWIDDPDSICTNALQGILAFFRKDHVLWKRRLETAKDRIMGAEIARFSKCIRVGCVSARM